MEKKVAEKEPGTLISNSLYITNMIKNNEIEVRCCPTRAMICGYMSKPLIGSKFENLRDYILNLTDRTLSIEQKE